MDGKPPVFSQTEKQTKRLFAAGSVPPKIIAPVLPTTEEKIIKPQKALTAIVAF